MFCLEVVIRVAFLIELEEFDSIGGGVAGINPDEITFGADDVGGNFAVFQVLAEHVGGDGQSVSLICGVVVLPEVADDLIAGNRLGLVQEQVGEQVADFGCFEV